MIAFVTALALMIVCATCTVAVFSRNYAENWLEFAGLCLLVLWTLARLDRLLDGDIPPPTGMLLHVGAASFAIGKFWKLWRARPPAATGASKVWRDSQAHFESRRP